MEIELRNKKIKLDNVSKIQRNDGKKGGSIFIGYKDETYLFLDYQNYDELIEDWRELTRTLLKTEIEIN